VALLASNPLDCESGWTLRIIAQENSTLSTLELNMEIVDSLETTLRAIGKNEIWLQKWLLEKPSRLGLGDIEIIQQELRQYRNRGGRLDILAYRGDLDTYYEIELMLGECDSDHGFRTLDYWARERLKNPTARHVAVLVAEDLSGRYKTIIETLPQFLPFIGIELKVIKLPYQDGIATIKAYIVAQPDDLIIDSGDEPEQRRQISSPRDREWWESNSSNSFIRAVDEIAKYCIENIGPSRVDYTARSYVSLKKGRRCWLPMWPRTTGVYVYIPSDDTGTEDAPSDFFEQVKNKLASVGLDTPSWTYKYNAGANPIGFAIPLEKAAHSVIREILDEAYQLA
jgi:hypothetical protein